RAPQAGRERPKPKRESFHHHRAPDALSRHAGLARLHVHVEQHRDVLRPRDRRRHHHPRLIGSPLAGPLARSRLSSRSRSWPLKLTPQTGTRPPQSELIGLTLLQVATSNFSDQCGRFFRSRMLHRPEAGRRRRQPKPSRPARAVATRKHVPGSGTAAPRLIWVSLSMLMTLKFGSGEKNTEADCMGGRG